MNKPDSYYQRVLAKIAPELDPLHMETLAYSIGSTLNGMPHAFFEEVAKLARQWGPDRLAIWHNREVSF